MAWNSEGMVTNPDSAQVLADTGQLNAGSNNYTILVYTDTSCSVELQHRNTLDTVTLHSQVLGVPGPNLETHVPLATLLNERFRVVLVGGFTGKIQASIIS